jgi:AMMECR1 domain-containing protein
MKRQNREETLNGSPMKRKKKTKTITLDERVAAFVKEEYSWAKKYSIEGCNGAYLITLSFYAGTPRMIRITTSNNKIDSVEEL